MNEKYLPMLNFCFRIYLRSYFASSAKAMMPAAIGAEAEVPVWLSVQRCLRSVVIWKKLNCVKLE